MIISSEKNKHLKKEKGKEKEMTYNFLCDYFKFALKNDTLNDRALKWIENNHQRLLVKYINEEGKEEQEQPSWLFDEKFTSIEDVREEEVSYRYGKSEDRYWHKTMSYDRIYEIYKNLGFNHEESRKLARRVRSLMIEYEEDKADMGWGHQPSVYAWLPPVFCRVRKESLDIQDYYYL